MVVPSWLAVVGGLGAGCLVDGIEYMGALVGELRISIKTWSALNAE